MIHWVFLDVGNILLDEDPIAYHCTRLHWEAVRQVHPDVTLLDLIKAREERSFAGSRWPLYDVVSSLIDETACDEAWTWAEQEIRAQFGALSPLIAGAVELLDRLEPRFNLGIIANQGAECRARLDDLGLLARFKSVVLSEEVQRFKPDLELYQRALDQAGVPPGECVMIGDRLDNDIRPAGVLGMATIWVRWPDRRVKGWQPSESTATAFRDSLQRAASRAFEQYQGVPPSLIVNDLSEIDAGKITRLERMTNWQN